MYPCKKSYFNALPLEADPVYSIHQKSFVYRVLTAHAIFCPNWKSLEMEWLELDSLFIYSPIFVIQMIS